MTEGIKQFRDLMLHDEEFQKKLKAATDAFTGEQTEEAVYNEVLSPLAKEYGISVSFEEFHEFAGSDHEMDAEELLQVAGGKGGGLGFNCCAVVGMGVGAGGAGHSGGACVLVGAGWGEHSCDGSGREW